MENRRRNHPFSGDIFDSLVREDKNFHWSSSYKWFLNKSANKKKTYKLWTIRLANVGCVPEVSDFKELI
jgi:hypothetical protein